MFWLLKTSTHSLRVLAKVQCFLRSQGAVKVECCKSQACLVELTHRLWHGYVCVCLHEPLLTSRCDESNVVRKELLQKMNTHKHNGRDCVWVCMCVCVCLCVVRVSVQVINVPGGWVEESVYKTRQPSFPFSYHAPSFHLYSLSGAKIPFVFPLIPSRFCLGFSLSSISFSSQTSSLPVPLRAKALAVNKWVQYYFTGQRLQSFPLFGTINKAKTWGEQSKKRWVGEREIETEWKTDERGTFQNKTELVTLCKSEKTIWEGGHCQIERDAEMIAQWVRRVSGFECFADQNLLS